MACTDLIGKCLRNGRKLSDTASPAMRLTLSFTLDPPVPVSVLVMALLVTLGS